MALNNVGCVRSDHLVQGAVHAESGRADALVPDAWHNASAAAAGAAAQPYTVAAGKPSALAAAQPPALAAAQPSAVKPSTQPPALTAAEPPAIAAAQPPSVRPPAVRRRRRRRVHCLCDHGQPMDRRLRLRQHHQPGAPRLSSQPAAASATGYCQDNDDAGLSQDYMQRPCTRHPGMPLCRSPALVQRFMPCSCLKQFRARLRRC